MLYGKAEFLRHMGGEWYSMAAVNAALAKHERSYRCAWKRNHHGEIIGVVVRSAPGAPNPGLHAEFMFPFEASRFAEAENVARGLHPSGQPIS